MAVNIYNCKEQTLCVVGNQQTMSCIHVPAYSNKCTDHHLNTIKCGKKLNMLKTIQPTSLNFWIAVVFKVHVLMVWILPFL